ncbi:MAG TPA: TonB-dependent receptor [Xanthomonadales bacterium]|nr:TonB-dependent receptor [Xanthomonadales bacterium]
MKARSAGLFALIITPFLFSSPLVAQSTDERSEDGTLEEVLVTATRRGEEDILTTPVSITALDGEAIEKYAIRDLNDISVSVPGLSSGTVSAFKSAQFAMRGVTETSIIVYKESPVAVTLDDFVIPHIQTSNLEMFDIETIEVLRGPQGTLFGKNTTGGVIAVRTKRPVLDEDSLDFQVQYGDFGTQKYNAALNLAVSDNMAFRFSGMYLNSDGYYKNGAPYGPLGEGLAPFNTVQHLGAQGPGDGRDLGGDDVFTGRAKFLWQPTENVNLMFQYEYVNDDGDSPPIVQESTTGYVFPLWNYPPGNTLPGDVLDNAGSSLRCDANPAGVCITQGHLVDIDGYYLNGDWAINDEYTLHFNAGKREQKSRLPSSYGGATGPISLFDATRDDNRDTSQAEVRVGSSLDGNFNFTAGLYYQEDDTEFCVEQYVGFLDGFFTGAPPDFFNDNPLLLCNRQDADAIAAYIDGTWNLGERWTITAGYRWTDESKSWAGRPRVGTLDGQPILDVISQPLDGADFNRFPEGVVYDSESWSEPTYRLIFGYDISDDTYAFFGYSRGFKSGGYNDQIGTQLNPIIPDAARPTNPEIADSYEGGIKSTLADGAATIAFNTYYVEYTDAQRTFNVSFPGGGQETLFFNAAEMTVWGVEAEGSWLVNDDFQLNYNVAYMDAKFDSFQADTDFDGVIDIDLSGQPVTRAPEWMGSIEGVFDNTIGEQPFEWRLRVSYEDDSIASYSDVDPIFDATLDSRTLVDASVTWTAPSGGWYIRALGSNLTDERYRAGSLSVATLWIMSAYGAPRYWGLELGGKFGW